MMEGSDNSVDEHTLLIRQSPKLKHSCCPKLKPKDRHFACLCIFVSQGLASVAFYAMAGNLAYYLKLAPLCWNEAHAVSTTSIVMSARVITGLIGGFISDSFFGRYRVIVGSFVVYICGYIWLVVLTYYFDPDQKSPAYCSQVPCIPAANQTCLEKSQPTPCTWTSKVDEWLGFGETCGASLMICFMIICCAEGSIHANLPTFGGEQLRERTSNESKGKFFQYYYFAINCGGLIAALPLAILQQTSFFCSFIITTGCLLLSLIVFLSGSKFYINRVPQRKGFTFWKVIKLIAFSLKQKWHHRKDPECSKPPSFLNYAEVQYGGSGYTPLMVEDVQSLWKVTRVLCLLLLAFQTAYGSTFGTFFLLQGLHMDVSLGQNYLNCSGSETAGQMINALCHGNQTYLNSTHKTSHVIPAAALTAFDDVSVLLFLLVVGKILSLLKSRGIDTNFKRRLVTGHVTVTLALLVAALVEYFRLKKIDSCGYFEQHIGDTVYYAADMSIFYQIPQYVLMGISEVLVLVTGLEFAFIESPESMQGLMVGLFWFVAGVGSFLSLPIVELVKKLIPGIITAVEINCNKEYYFMLILAGIVMIGTLILILAGKFKVL